MASETAAAILADVIDRMGKAQGTSMTQQPGPSPDTLVSVRLGYSDGPSISSARDAKLELRAELRDGQPVIVVRRL